MATTHARLRSLAALILLGAIALGALGALTPLPAAAQGDAQVPSRGAMLYANHCIACHATQMHWRAKRQASDWASLREQVLRWQGVARLEWSDEDVLDVVRHLNDTIYRFAPPPDPRG